MLPRHNRGHSLHQCYFQNFFQNLSSWQQIQGQALMKNQIMRQHLENSQKFVSANREYDQYPWQRHARALQSHDQKKPVGRAECG